MYSVDEKCEKDKVKLRSIVAENFEINEKIKYETLEVDFLPWRYFSLIIKKKNILRLQQLVIRALNRFTLKSEWWIIIPCNDFVNNFCVIIEKRVYNVWIQIAFNLAWTIGGFTSISSMRHCLLILPILPVGLDCFVSNDVIYSSKDREWKKINSRHFRL